MENLYGTGTIVVDFTRRRILSVIARRVAGVDCLSPIARARDKSGFPDGYDAVKAPPNSHKVIFENAVVRVLEVIIPPPETTEPMHHHHWPSSFLNWDTGGKTPHVHSLRRMTARATRLRVIERAVVAKELLDRRRHERGVAE